MKNLRQRTLALAALFQAVYCVDKLAKFGHAPVPNIETCLNSLFVFDAPDTESIYGGIVELQTGLSQLIKHLETDKVPADMDRARYAIMLLNLKNKLIKNSALLDKITQGLEVAKTQSEHFGSVVHENVLANIADIYSQHISPLSTQIMIQGEEIHLSNPLMVNKIRSLLLAGIRAAILWHQVGGRRWHILFARKQLVNMAETILKQDIPKLLN